MADVCDDDGVSGAMPEEKGAERLLFSFYTYNSNYSLIIFDFELII